MKHRWMWQALMAIGLISAMGCDPVELPPADPGEPVFTLDGSLGGTPFAVTAGDDGYFMFTDTYAAEEELWVAEGRLAEPGCSSNCPPAWQFEFHAPQAALDSLLQTTEWPYTEPTGSSTPDTTYRLMLQASSEHSDALPVLSHQWSFFDSTTAFGETVEKALPGPGRYLVALQTLTEDSCYSYTEQEVGIASPIPDCTADFLLFVDTTGQLLAEYIPQAGVQPSLLLWQDSIPGEVFISFYDGNPREICLQATFPGNCTVRRCKSVLPSLQGQAPALCSNSIESTLLIDVDTVPAVALPGVSVQYTDESGKVYRTDHAAQPGTANFRIIEAAPYENNADGLPTLRLQVAFSCQLYLPDGTPWQLMSGQGAIAVALPD